MAVLFVVVVSVGCGQTRKSTTPTTISFAFVPASCGGTSEVRLPRDPADQGKTPSAVFRQWVAPIDAVFCPTGMRIADTRITTSGDRGDFPDAGFVRQTFQIWRSPDASLLGSVAVTEFDTAEHAVAFASARLGALRLRPDQHGKVSPDVEVDLGLTRPGRLVVATVASNSADTQTTVSMDFTSGNRLTSVFISGRDPARNVTRWKKLVLAASKAAAAVS